MKLIRHWDLATFSVDAAGGATVVFRAGLQADVLGVQSHRSVFQDVARDTHITNSLGLVKSGMGIAQVQELLQVPDVLSDINHLEIGVTFDLLFHVFAVGAGMHDEHLYHRYSVLYHSCQKAD